MQNHEKTVETANNQYDDEDSRFFVDRPLTKALIEGESTAAIILIIIFSLTGAGFWKCLGLGLSCGLAGVLVGLFAKFYSDDVVEWGQRIVNSKGIKMNSTMWILVYAAVWLVERIVSWMGFDNIYTFVLYLFSLPIIAAAYKESKAERDLSVAEDDVKVPKVIKYMAIISGFVLIIVFAMMFWEAQLNRSARIIHNFMTNL